MNKLSQNFPKTELVHFSNCKDESIVLKNTEITCTEYVKYLGILLDKNLTYGFQVKRVLNKLTKHVSIINRLRHFTSNSVGRWAFGSNEFARICNLSLRSK